VNLEVNFPIKALVMDSARQEILGSAFRYSIFHVPHDDAGVRKYLEEYKALRLFSLQYALEAFGSTYAREVAFEDDVWYQRLSNPIANTFLAIGETGNLIGVSTINGPLAIGILDMPPLGIPQTARGGWNGASPLHFRLNAIFTVPEASRKGISKTLIETSIKYVMDEAQTRNKDTIFSIIVDIHNLPAQALYKSAGFVEATGLGPSDNVYGHPVIILEYRPPPASAKAGGV
jgi:GNAT superfamily N-acetyltransferase